MKNNPGLQPTADPASCQLTNPHHIRILIADDNQPLRTALKHILETLAEYEVVGEAADGIEAVRLTQVCRPDVVIMDIAMPQKDGLTATAELTRDFPQVRVLVWSSQSNARCVQQAIRAGAVGYLVKGGQTHIEVAISAIASGQRYFDPLIARYVPQGISGVN